MTKHSSRTTDSEPRSLSRASFGELEVRSTGGRSADRYLTGWATRFGEPTEVGGVLEAMVPGVFRRSIEQRLKNIPLLWSHQMEDPIGTPVRLEERSDGLWGEWRIASTESAQEKLRLVEDGVVSGLSVGFRPLRDQFIERDGRFIREITAAKLFEVSLVSLPAYEGARTESVRSNAELAVASWRKRFERARGDHYDIRESRTSTEA